MATVLQNFDIRFANGDYDLKVIHNLSVKPRDMAIKATLRHGMTANELGQRLHSTGPAAQSTKNGEKLSNGVPASESQNPLTILFGSNTGTCQSLARKLATDAIATGFNPTISAMDDMVGQLSRDHPNIIITTSYEGEPADNALNFVHYLESLQGNALEGVKFAVFGCGHRKSSNLNALR